MPQLTRIAIPIEEARRATLKKIPEAVVRHRKGVVEERYEDEHHRLYDVMIYQRLGRSFWYRWVPLPQEDDV
jgi:hypothetical protein